MIIYLIRHGETDANRQGIIQGQLDTELNEVGISQAKNVAKALKGVPFDLAISSDMSRAVKTAESILEFHSALKLQKIKELRERDLGNLQGRKLSELKRANSDASVESREHMRGRALAWWDGLVSLQKDASAPQKVLVVSHGGFIGTLLLGLLNTDRMVLGENVQMQSRFVLNVSITIIEVADEGRATMTQYASVKHLQDQIEVTENSAADQVVK